MVKFDDALLRRIRENDASLGKELDLEYNKIGDDGAARLGEGLAGNTTLTELYLWNNNIGDEGAARLGEGLAGNTTLTTLGLGGNNIGDEGAARLL